MDGACIPPDVLQKVSDLWQKPGCLMGGTCKQLLSEVEQGQCVHRQITILHGSVACSIMGHPHFSHPCSKKMHGHTEFKRALGHVPAAASNSCQPTASHAHAA